MHTRTGILSGALAALAACGPGPQQDAPVRASVPVSFATVLRDSILDELAVTGRFAPVPGGSARLAAPAAGVVALLPVQIGSRVGRGTVVAEIIVPELAARALSQSATAAQARRETERQRQLLADGVTSRRQAEEAATAARTTEAEARASNQLMAQTRVRSPIAGLVRRVGVRLGERVDAGALLVEVLKVDTLDLITAIPSDPLPRVHRGQSAWVQAEGVPNPVEGRIAAVAPGVDSLTNAGEVVIRVPNPDGALRAGSGATGRIALGARRGVLVVPEAALALAGRRPVVFVVGGDSVAHQRIVAQGLRNGGRVEVTGPLHEGELVVTVGAAGLRDGMRVVAAP